MYDASGGLIWLFFVTLSHLTPLVNVFHGQVRVLRPARLTRSYIKLDTTQ